jgi:uncharacterized membrane protein
MERCTSWFARDSSKARQSQFSYYFLRWFIQAEEVELFRPIRRFFQLRETSVETAHLAGGLAVSAWWLVFAGALVTLGLRRDIRPARLGGLGVAGLAVLKVLLFDLSSLDALYRVGSVFILGFVSLLLAYLYHRQARGSPPG